MVSIFKIRRSSKDNREERKLPICISQRRSQHAHQVSSVVISCYNIIFISVDMFLISYIS